MSHQKEHPKRPNRSLTEKREAKPKEDKAAKADSVGAKKVRGASCERTDSRPEAVRKEVNVGKFPDEEIKSNTVRCSMVAAHAAAKSFKEKLGLARTRSNTIMS